MKISIILLLVQVAVVFCQDKAIPSTGQCLTGFKPICPPHEVWGCGYSEPRCTPRFVCGTPPCHNRCWCAPNYKRNDLGVCVRFCPLKPIKITDLLAPVLKVIG